MPPLGQPALGPSGRPYIDPKVRLFGLTSALKLRTVTPIINLWAVFSTAANACILSYVIGSLATGFTAVPIVQQRLLAFGGFFMYLTLTQYLKYNARFFLLIGTLRRGLPNIFRFFVGTFPIYVGFLMFGIVMFGDIATRFDGTINGAIALFAVLNGDSIRETYLISGCNNASQSVSIAVQAYLYIFLILFIYVALKSTIAIMEDGFIGAHPFMEETKDENEEVDDGSDSDSSDTTSSGDLDTDRASRQSVASSVDSHGRKKAKHHTHKSEPTYRLPPRIRAILVAMHDMDAMHTFGKHRIQPSARY